MSAKYFPHLFLPYSPLTGRDWIRKIDREALMVFVDIGLKACNHGRMGGEALAKDREHMSRIGRIGAIASNSKRAWKRAVAEETERVFGLDINY